MAILLVKVADNPVPDSPGKWCAGDCVAVVEDDHQFGSAETPEAGNFLHVSVAGTKADNQWRISEYTEAAQEMTTPAMRKIPRLAELVMRDAERKPIGRSKYRYENSKLISRRTGNAINT